MIEIETENAAEVLTALGHLSGTDGTSVEWLSWGVSNCVLRVGSGDGQEFVVKQSRRQLRTEVDWFSQLERIWREVEVLRYLADILPDGAVPRILFEEREHYLFGMQAIDRKHTVWKSDLLAGCCDDRVATVAGRYLGQIHHQSAGQDTLRERWTNLQVFEELRIDPFYRYVAEREPQLSPALHALIDDTLSRAVCLVLADFSPKNILITGEQITLVDFETAHYGDPAFDLGFFVSHLVLKTILFLDQRQAYQRLIAEFWSEYSRQMTRPGQTQATDLECLERRAVLHLGACLAARIDGTSPIDYLRDARQTDLARQIAHRILLQPVDRFECVFDMLPAE
ncbi:MAG: aminoglycoside phosphotransferase family protein [Planctomycetaceae bacterium]